MTCNNAQVIAQVVAKKWWLRVPTLLPTRNTVKDKGTFVTSFSCVARCVAVSRHHSLALHGDAIGSTPNYKEEYQLENGSLLLWLAYLINVPKFLSQGVGKIGGLLVYPGLKCLSLYFPIQA